MAKSIPIPNVESGLVNQLSGGGGNYSASGIPDMSITGMFMDADIVVQIVIIFLLLASFWSWTIIFDKLLKFRVQNRLLTSFEGVIWSSESLEKKYQVMKNQPHNAIAKVFVAGMYLWMKSKQTPESQHSLLPESDSKPKNTDEIVKDRVLQAMDTARNREISGFEKGNYFLATVGSSAPFIGLFGTVWGIMDSFQAIAMTKNTTLAVVAPGIAEALFATAVGLFAAIPAVIFYNKFSNEVAIFADRIDTFIDEFSLVISREIEG